MALALVALAWLQVSAAAHQFEHVAGDLDVVCDVCLQVERLDDVIAPESPPQLLAAEFHPYETPALVGHTAVRLRHFDSRAPPRA